MPPPRSRLFPSALLALLLAVVVAVLGSDIQPVAGEELVPVDERTVKYKFTIIGNFDADALASGVTAPSNAKFSRLVAGSHSSNVTFWSDGGAAGAQLEALAETGNGSAENAFRNLIRNHAEGNSAERSQGPAPGATGTATTGSVQFDGNHTLLTAVAKIKPSPDWFVGVSNHDLRPNGVWTVEQTIDLYAWDAGTDGGDDFGAADDPGGAEGTIASLRNTGKFSDSPIAQLKIELQTPPDRGVDHDDGIHAHENIRLEPADGKIVVRWRPFEDVYVDGYKIQWIDETQTDADFETAEADGRQGIATGPDARKHTISGLTNGVEYTVRVITFNGAGDGGSSDTSLSNARTTPAQFTGMLVSNRNQLPLHLAQVSDDSSGGRLYINQFTTGSAAATLSGVSLRLGVVHAGSPAFDLHLYSDSAGSLGSKLSTFVQPDSWHSQGLARFTPPPGPPIILAANTSYWLQIEWVSGVIDIWTTKGDDEDLHSRAGWSIGDMCQVFASGAYELCGFKASFSMSLDEPPADQLPVFSIAGGQAVVEGSALQFAVNLNQLVGEQTTVQYSTVDGTATSGDSDFTAASGTTLTFAANQTSKTITINTTSDSTDEDDEAFTVQLSNPSANAEVGGASSASGRIINNDETTMTDATVSAITLVGAGGATIALNETFNRYRYHYTASTGAGSLHGTVTFRTGVTPQSVEYVQGSGGTATEDSVSTDYDADYSLGFGENLVQFKITSQQDQRVKLYTVAVVQTESSDATLSALTLVRGGGNGADIPFSPSFDPAVTSYTAIVAPRILTAIVTGTPNHDSATAAYTGEDVYEDGDAAEVELFLGENAATITVTAEDGTTMAYTVTIVRTIEVSISAPNSTIDEGGAVEVTVTLSADPEEDVEIPLAAIGLGGATTSDYSLSRTTLSFGPSDDSKTFTFNATQDEDDEPGESVTLGFGTLPDGVEAHVDNYEITLSITNDDVAGIPVDFAAASYDAPEGGSATLTVTLGEAPGAGASVTIPLTASHLGGASSADYTWPSPAQVVFGASDTSQTFTFNAAQDTLDDDNEQVAVGFGTLPSGYAPGDTPSTMVNIIDDDGVVAVNFRSATYSVLEGETVTVTVTLNEAPGTGNSVTIPLTTTNLGTAANNDYSGVPSSVEFENSETSRSFDFKAKLDRALDTTEVDERVQIALGTLPTGYKQGRITATTVTLADTTVHVKFNVSSPQDLDEGETKQVAVVFDKPVPRAITINVISLPTAGTDAEEADFTVTPSSLEFAIGDKRKSFTVEAVDDSVDDDDERFEVRLPIDHNPPDGVAFTDNFSIHFDIVDDDTKDLTLSAASVTMTEGESATFTVELATQPTANVSVSVSSADTGAVTASPPSLMFTKDNWNTGQTVMVTGVQDLDQDDEDVTVSLSASGGGYNNQTDSVQVTVTDESTANLVLTVTSLRIGEAGSGVFGVWLAKQPTASVTVDVASGDTGAATVSPANLSFSTSNWDQAQAVTVSGVADDDAADETVTVSLIGESSDNDFEGAGGSVSVQVDDDEERSLDLSPTSLTVDESGSRTFMVQLTSRPTGPVTVSVSSDDTGAATISPTSLSFTTNNWNVAKTVTVRGVQDGDSADETVTVSLSASGADYAGVAGTVTVSVTDDDRAGLSLSESELTVIEAGSGTFTVKLGTQPTAGVSVSISSDDTGAATVSPASLAFTTGNWNTAQTVTVGGANDADEAHETVTVLLVATSTDSTYQGKTKTVAVSVLDDDLPLVTVEFKATGVTREVNTDVLQVFSVTEGESVEVIATLSEAPRRPVDARFFSLRADGVSPADYSGVPTEFSFGANETEASFTFTATDDTVDDDDEWVRLNLQITEKLPYRVELGAKWAAAVEIVDNDGVDLVLGATRLDIAEAGSAAFTIKLATQPTANVTVTVSSDDTDAATVSPASLTFTTTTWNSPQTVTVSGEQDDDAADEAVTVSLSASGGDYQGRTGSLSVIVDDDDEVDLVVDRTSLDIGEGGDGTFTVKLATQPTTGVGVSVASNDTGAATVSPANLSFTTTKSFTTANWNTPWTVTVSGTQDSDGDDEMVMVSLSASGGDYQGQTRSVSVDVADDDTPNLSLSTTTLTVTEGSSGTFTVKLATVPAADVEVSVSSDDPGAATVSPASVTFTTANWDSARTITVSGEQDTDEADESLTVSLSASSTDSDYQGKAGSVNVDVTDDEDPQVSVSFEEHTYTVAESDDPLTQDVTENEVMVMLTLSADPERTVTIPIMWSDLGGATSADYAATPRTVSFASSETEKTIRFVATHDTTDDDDESVKLSLPQTLPSRVSPGTTDETTVSITDDDDPAVTVSFDRAAYTVAESDETSTSGVQENVVTVTIRLSADPERTVTIPLTATEQNASSSDYGALPTSVTFNSGVTEQSFTFSATHDTIDDDGESVTLGFDTSHAMWPSGVTAGGETEATVTIADDDDPAVTVRFTQAAYTVPESDDTSTTNVVENDVEVTVELSADPERTVTIRLTNQGDAADYSVPSSVTFSRGETSKSVTFSALHDTIDDDGESVTLGFDTSHAMWPSGVTVSGTSQVTVSITDDDDPAVTVSFERAGYTVAESDDISTLAVTENQETVKVRLSADPERTVVIAIDKEGLDGASTADYSGVPDTVTFESGVTEQSFTFSATHDTYDDDGESVKLSFGALPSGVTAGTTNEATVAITDDDDPVVTVSLSPASATVTEGASATVTVSLDKDPERPVEITLVATGQGVTAEQVATSADYTGVPERVTFQIGETSKTFNLMVTQDTVDDDGESVKITFGTTLPAGVMAGTAKETVITITDDDDPQLDVSFEQSSYTVTEGSTVTVTVKLNADPERSVTIPLTRTNQDAADADYSGVPTSLTFVSGETERSFVFAAAHDNDDDDEESVKIGFSSSLPAGVTAVNPSETTVSITDDPADVPDVALSFGASSYDVDEGAMVTLTVTLDQAPERTLTIQLTKANQGGAGTADYSGVPASLEFGATDTEQSITFSAADDDVDDDAESVKLGFSSPLPAGVTAVNPSETTVSIADDPADVPDVTVMFDSGSHTLAEGGTLTITVSLSEPPERAVTIPIVIEHLDGATESDYSGVPSQLDFAANEDALTLTITAAPGTYDMESVKLSFGTLPDGVSESGTNPSETTIQLTDDEIVDVVVEFDATSYSANEGGEVTVTLTLDVDPERSVTIPLTHTPQHDTTAADYSGVPPSVTFESGQTSASFPFAATQDTDDDDGDSVQLVLGSLPNDVTAGTDRTATVSIVDDDDPEITVGFAEASYQVGEGDTADVTVTLSAAPEREIEIPLSFTNHGADGADYTVPDAVTFTATATVQTVTLSATQDEVDDDDESVDIEFGSPLPNRVSLSGTTTTTVGIEDDDDPEVTVSFGSPAETVAEGSSVTITVTLDADPERSLTIPLSVSLSTDASASDYSGVPAELAFTSGGPTFQTIVFTAVDDTEDDDDEEVSIAFDLASLDRVSNGAVPATTIGITDDDDPQVTVMFGAEGYTAVEGGSVTVTVSLSADPERTVTIPLEISPDGGISAGDYSGVPTNVAFGSGETEQTFTIEAATDEENDDDESITLEFGDLPGGVTPGVPAATTVSIADGNVPAVMVWFGENEYTVAEDGVEVDVTVILSAAPERGVTIPLHASYGGGANADDFVEPPPSSVVFGEDDTAVTFAIAAAQDNVDDDGEGVTLSFGALPTLVTAGSPSEATVGITDDDDPEVTVSFEHAGYTVPEGSFENIRVVLSEDPERDVEITLTVATEPDGATEADYALDPPLDPFTFTIESGQTDYTFEFRSTPDNEDDDGETVTISIDSSLPDRVTPGDPAKAVITIEPRPVRPVISGGGGGGPPPGPQPSEMDFEWTVERDIDALDSGHDKPTGSWSDGRYLYVADNAEGAGDAVYAYDLETGERVQKREFELAEANRSPRGVWSGGGTVWVSDSGQERLFAYDLETGERDEEREIVLSRRNRDARGIWSDGETISVLNANPSLFAYDLETGTLLGEYELAEANSSPHGIWSDGVTVWVSNHDPKRLFAYRLPVPSSEPREDAEELERVIDEEFDELGRIGNNSPRGIWSDGDVMYVADESDGKVYSYNMPDAIDARLASLSLSGVDIGEFSPKREEYEGVAADDVTATTVEAQAAYSGASVVIDPPDADRDTDGHQATVEGGSEITVTVTSEDASRIRSYHVRLGEAGPSATCLRGAVAIGFSLVVYEGGGVDDLVACAQSRHITTLYALTEGAYVPYILRAPDFVNQQFREVFPDGVPAATPLVASSGGPPSADPFADAAVSLSWPECLRGEVVEGFSLVVYEGGSVEGLESCVRSRNVTAVYALAEGEWVSYILGAPDFVNRPFFELFAGGLPPLTPLVAKSDESPGAGVDDAADHN